MDRGEQGTRASGRLKALSAIPTPSTALTRTQSTASVRCKAMVSRDLRRPSRSARPLPYRALSHGLRVKRGSEKLS